MSLSMQKPKKDIFNITFTVLGEPCSKANQRQLVKIKDRIVPIKSKKALNYVKEFQKQIPKIDPLTEDYVKVEMMIYYASRRPRRITYTRLYARLCLLQRQTGKRETYLLGSG